MIYVHSNWLANETQAILTWIGKLVMRIRRDEWVVNKESALIASAVSSEFIYCLGLSSITGWWNIWFAEASKSLPEIFYLFRFQNFNVLASV